MLRRLLCCLSLGLFSAVLVSSVSAQKLEDGRTKFFESPEYRSAAPRALRNDLNKGGTLYDAKDANHKAAVAIMASEYVYPIYWDGVESFKAGQLNRHVEDWARWISTLSGVRMREKTAGLQQALIKEVTDRCSEVMKKSNKPIVSVNVAMLLSRIPARRSVAGALQTKEDWAEEMVPRLAEGNGEHLVVTCIDLLKAEQAKEGKKVGPNDGVRYYLFRTLSSVLSVPTKKELVKKETEEQAVQLALAFVEKAPKPGKSAPRAEQEGYKVLRREAVKVIAASRAADLGDKGKPALILARIAAGDDRVSPSPRVDEQLEAAMGLARMAGDKNKAPGLHEDYAAWAVQFAVYDFAVAANKEVEKREKLERRRPWMVDAARFLEGVEALKGDGKNAYVAAVLKECSGVLSSIQDGKGGAASDLGQWERDNKPTSKSLYRDADDSTIKRTREEKGD